MPEWILKNELLNLKKNCMENLSELGQGQGDWP